MKRLLPALLGLSLLLTACPGPSRPPVVSVERDPRVLQGRWAADLVERLEVRDVTAGAGRVYLVDWGGAIRPGEVGRPDRLLALDARSGARLAAVDRPGAQVVALRADGVVAVLGGGRLTLHDPVTLERRAERPLPGDRLSADGEVALESTPGGLRRFSTRTGEVLPTAAALAPASPFFLSSDAAWGLVGGRAVRASDGQGVGGASAHGNPCQLTRDFGPVSVENAPADVEGAGVLLGYSDGVVEWRRADGTLRGAFPLSDACQPVQKLRRVGDRVAFLSGPSPYEVTGAGWLDLSTGEVPVRRPLTGRGESWLTPEGAAVRSQEGGSARAPLLFQPWEGEHWTPPLAGRRLTLDVKTTRRTERAAAVTGRAELDGRLLEVSGELNANGALLAQWSPPPPPSLTFTLTLSDGGRAVGTLTGSGVVVGDTDEERTSPQTPRYGVGLTLPNDPQMFGGELRRP